MNSGESTAHSILTQLQQTVTVIVFPHASFTQTGQCHGSQMDGVHGVGLFVQRPDKLEVQDATNQTADTACWKQDHLRNRHSNGAQSHFLLEKLDRSLNVCFRNVAWFVFILALFCCNIGFCLILLSVFNQSHFTDFHSKTVIINNNKTQVLHANLTIFPSRIIITPFPLLCNKEKSILLHVEMCVSVCVGDFRFFSQLPAQLPLVPLTTWEKNASPVSVITQWIVESGWRESRVKPT